MAIDIQGVRWVLPSELDFNNVQLAASQTRVGLIVPWVARGSFKRVSMMYEKVSGSGSSVNLQAAAIGPDGSTVIGAFASFLNTVTDDSFGHVNLTGVLTASIGSVVATGVAYLMGAPYIQFRMTNNDATNSINVRLQFALHVD
jgi:hypothetical protein